MSLSFVSRILSRIKGAFPGQKPLSLPIADPPNVNPASQDTSTFAQDIEFALESDASIRAARQLFDVSAIDSSADEISPTVSSALPTVLQIEHPANEHRERSAEGVTFDALIETLQMSQPDQSSRISDISAYTQFAALFEPFIPPQLSEQHSQFTGRLSLRDRAHRYASKLADTFELTREDEQGLAKLLRRSRLHYKTLREIEALLHKGYSVDELTTARHFRKLWHRSDYLKTAVAEYHSSTHSIFAGAGRGFGSITDWVTEFYNSYSDSLFITTNRIPTWSKAARWAASLGAIPCGELDSLLYCYFERWIGSPSLWKLYPSFFGYFDQCVRAVLPDLQDTLPWDIAFQLQPVDEHFEQDIEAKRTKALYELNLIPDIWLDPFDERVAIDPEFPLLDDYWPKGGGESDDE